MGSSPRRLDSLTSLRFFAALAVALNHSLFWGKTSLTACIGHFGFLGVTLFFILSGFVLMWNYNPNQSKLDFYFHRIVRIYPLHWLCLTYLIIGWNFGCDRIPGYLGTPWWGTIMNYLLIHDWLWLNHNQNVRQGWNGVTWSLSCECFFYIIAPYLFVFMSRLKLPTLFSIIAVVYFIILSIVIALNFAHNIYLADLFWYDPLPRLLEFVMGAGGALLIKSGHFFRYTYLALATFIIPLWIANQLNSHIFDCLLSALFIPGAFLLIWSLASQDICQAKSWMQIHFLVLLGEASYAFYLTHAIILDYFEGYFTGPFKENYLLGECARIISIGTSFAFALFLFTQIEKRIQTWFKLYRTKFITANPVLPLSTNISVTEVIK